MARTTISSLCTCTWFLLLFATTPANATVDHTYVSGTGSDTGGCTSPNIACRTFAYAISQTSPFGEIIVINPADYGPVTIAKSMSIVAEGAGPAGIILPAGNAITIAAGATDVVNLRGLTLDGEGTAASGIALSSGGTLTISDCVVRHFANAGILLTPLGTPLNVSILTSVMDNDGSGLTVVGSGLTHTFLTVGKSVANYNTTGFSVTGATVIFASTMAIGNSQAAILVGPITGDTSHSALLSYGDNEFDLNGTNVSGGGALGLLTKQ